MPKCGKREYFSWMDAKIALEHLRGDKRRRNSRTRRKESRIYLCPDGCEEANGMKTWHTCSKERLK